jgi:actin-related protein
MKKNRNSHISAILITVFLLSVPGLFAQNVDRSELEKNQANIDFINYEGPHSRIDTVAQIRDIGYQLGLAVRNGASRAGAGNRYFVIHSVTPPDGEKLDADIFGLGIDVGVDHIDNLRLIIQGYLQGAYEYSARDAVLLSRYVTIYNAVFRSDWAFYNSRYKVPVIQNMVEEKAGLSIRFDEWPGQTLMTIPLGTGNPGSLSAIDTSSLTDPGVVDQMRRDDDRGIDDRQGMVDLKEREADEANQSATLQREAIAEEEQNIARDQAEAASTRQRVEQEQRRTEQQQQEARRQQEEAQRRQQEAQRQQEQARRDQEAGRISQQEAQRQQEEAQRRQQEAQRQQEEAQSRQEEAQRQQQELAQQQQENEQRQQEIAQRQQDQEQRKQEADATEQRAEQKTEEAQQERQDIARDQQELIDNQGSDGTAVASAAGTQPGDTGTQPGSTPAAASGAGANSNLLAASILQNDSALGRLVRINSASGAAVQTSQMNTVNARTITQVDGRILAIAGVNRGNGAIRLVEINSDTLEMAKQGDDDIHPQSLLWINGNNLYAVTVVGGKNYLAKFDMNLTKQLQTAVEVHPYAACIFQGDRILTQKADGSPLMLNAQTLR